MAWKDLKGFKGKTAGKAFKALWVIMEFQFPDRKEWMVKLGPRDLKEPPEMLALLARLVRLKAIAGYLCNKSAKYNSKNPVRHCFNVNIHAIEKDNGESIT